MILAEIHNIEENKEHTVSKVVCLKCLNMWIAVRPVGTKLESLECGKCGLVGFTIETGEYL